MPICRTRASSNGQPIMKKISIIIGITLPPYLLTVGFLPFDWKFEYDTDASFNGEVSAYQGVSLYIGPIFISCHKV